jgi:hypothetical protein
VHVAQLTFVDKFTESKRLILLSCLYARKKAATTQTFFAVSAH